MSEVHNLGSLLVRTAQRWPRLPAVAIGETVVQDYAALAQRASRLASAFLGNGLASGDRVVLVSRNCAQYVEALFACWIAGLVAVPVNAKLHPKELAFVLADSGARWALTDDAWHAALAGGIERAVALGSREY